MGLRYVRAAKRLATRVSGGPKVRQVIQPGPQGRDQVRIIEAVRPNGPADPAFACHVAGRAPDGDGFIQQGVDRVRNFEFGSWQGAQLDLHTWMQQRFLTPHQVIGEAQLSRFGRALEDMPAPPDPTPVSGSSAEGESKPTLPSSRNARVEAVDLALADWDVDELAGNRLGSQLQP